jgi:hypothetical protein
MRRAWALFASVGLVTLALGCCHVAGICDCEAPCDPCGCHGGCNGNGHPPMVTTSNNNGNNNSNNSNDNSNNGNSNNGNSGQSIRVKPKDPER